MIAILSQFFIPWWLWWCWIVEELRLSDGYEIVWARLWVGCEAGWAVITRVGLRVHVTVAMMVMVPHRMKLLVLGAAVNEDHGSCLRLSVPVRSIGADSLLSSYIVMDTTAHSVVWRKWLPTFTDTRVAHVARGTTGMKRRIDLATNLRWRKHHYHTHTLAGHSLPVWIYRDLSSPPGLRVLPD